MRGKKGVKMYCIRLEVKTRTIKHIAWVSCDPYRQPRYYRFTNTDVIAKFATKIIARLMLQHANGCMRAYCSGSNVKSYTIRIVRYENRYKDF